MRNNLIRYNRYKRSDFPLMKTMEAGGHLKKRMEGKGAFGLTRCWIYSRPFPQDVSRLKSAARDAFRSSGNQAA